MLGAWGCAAGEPCLPPGVCGGRPAVALFPGGGLELRSAAGLSAPSRAVAPAPVDATVPAIRSFVAADPDNGDSAVFNPNPSLSLTLAQTLRLSLSLTLTLTLPLPLTRRLGGLRRRHVHHLLRRGHRPRG